MKNKWIFDDPPETACFTTTFVLEGSPILRVYHDYDGDWQFHGSKDHPATASVGKLVCLDEIIKLDATLMQLHDLPYGWQAERKSKSKRWQRIKNNPFPSFEENGYYLEDAQWLSQYLSDIHPPSEKTRQNLGPGEYVKLVFRFAAEDADRADNECERMWVLVQETDEDGNYIGVLSNDPHHDAASNGDIIHFHPLHIAALG